MKVSDIAEKSRPDYWPRRFKKLEDEVAKLRTARSNAGAVASELISIQPQNYNLPTFTPSVLTNNELINAHTLTIPASDTWTTINLTAWVNVIVYAGSPTTGVCRQGATVMLKAISGCTGGGAQQTEEISIPCNGTLQIGADPLTAATTFTRTPGVDSVINVEVYSFCYDLTRVDHLAGVVTLLPIYTRG